MFNNPIVFPVAETTIMDEEKKWMLMTYYCPTHGDSGVVQPIEITKKEINKTFLRKGRNAKN